MNLFDHLTIRSLTFKNRIFVSPMCQYSSDNGMPNDWHLVHLGSFATGGAALVTTEATAVSPEGRISYMDAGIWSDEQSLAYQRITSFIKSQGAVAGIQLAHAGRKASTDVPWKGRASFGPTDPRGWQVVAPSNLKFSEDYPQPLALDEKGIQKVKDDFVAATKRALKAGFEVIELHFAHGYLFHEFLSPLSNKRTDQYGGSLENRMRFCLEVTKLVRQNLSDSHLLMVRISATDWVDGGWDLDQTVILSKELKKLGVDIIDASTGGNVPKATIPIGPHYQVKFAEAIKKEVGILTSAVGMITDPKMANEVIVNGQADFVSLARQMLRNPHWAQQAARELGAKIPYPNQYERAWI